ncbi:lipocalin family protein [bacterium]|nr:lipocalin family protein [bacterium]
MNRLYKFSMLKLITSVVFFSILSGATVTASEPEVIEFLDLQRYQGKWFEIARFSNPFQNKCKKNVTATYTILENGSIEVVNTCTCESGQDEDVKGLIKIIDTQTNAKLGVSFFDVFGWRPVWGDYWVLGLDQDYTVAVIGDPNRKYGWLLSRTKKLSPTQVKIALRIFDKNGYDSKSLIYTIHDD